MTGFFREAYNSDILHSSVITLPSLFSITMNLFVSMASPISPSEAIEDDFEDNFEDDFAVSEYGGTQVSAFSSVTSSVYAHCYERGRRYHVYKHGRYPIPNDDTEQGREEMKHVMLKELLDGKLFISDLENPQKIMDLGTGTGTWAIEVGDMFPQAVLLGTDLSPIQPTWLPPNVNFTVEDMEDEWVHSSDFDFIFLRHMISVLKDPAKLIQTVFTHLQPGGFIEAQEIRPSVRSDDGTLPTHHPLAKFYDILDGALKNYGFDIKFADNLDTVLRDVGYVNVQLTVYKLPLGYWPRSPTLKLVGYYMRTIILDFVAAMVSRPFAEAEVPHEECKRLMEEVPQALDDPNIHAYVPLYIFRAQKPY